MRFGNKIYYVIIGAGIVTLILGGTLISLLLRGDAEVVRDIVAPTEEFVYDTDEEYGEPLQLSSSLEAAFDDFYISSYHEILYRISAFFAINYPEHTSFSMVKDSYKKTENDAKTKISMGMVSNLGAIVWLELDETNYTSSETKLRLSNDAREVIYEATINWSEMEKIDGGGEPLEEENV